MRLLHAALCGTFLLTLAGCDATLLQGPESRALRPERGARANVYPCGDGYVCQPATEKTGYEMGVPVNVDSLATNCAQEACGTARPMQVVSVTVDPPETGSWVDVLNVRCSDNSLRSLPSDAYDCWDCKGNCAIAPVCPPGAECVTIHGKYGSDCRAFVCEDGWTIQPQTAGFTPPECRQPAPQSAPNAPVVTASVVNGHPRLAWTAVAGATSYRIYRAADAFPLDSWNEVAGTATSYADGSTRVTGMLGGPYGQWVSYRVVAVNVVGESGYTGDQYFSYNTVIPY